MRNFVRNSLRWKTRQEAGFSLMEIIVAIGIMAAIAAITVPLVTRFTSTGESGAATTERTTIQTAVDSYMAGNAVSTISALGVATNDFSATSVSACSASEPRIATYPVAAPRSRAVATRDTDVSLDTRGSRSQLVIKSPSSRLSAEFTRAILRSGGAGIDQTISNEPDREL